jgi:hypothetical protein
MVRASQGSGWRAIAAARLAGRAGALVCGLAATFLFASGAAFARAPVIKSVKVQNQKATYTWSLPTGVKARLVETATVSTTNEFGFFSPFSKQYSFHAYSSSTEDTTSRVDDRTFPPGTYYVHVAGEDAANPGCPPRQFSRTWLFVVNSSGDATGADIGGGTPACPKSGGGPGSDKDPPYVLLSFPHRQDVDKLFVKARTDESGTVTAKATVSMGGSSKVLRFVAVTRPIVADKRKKLPLKLKKGARRQVKRAVKRGKRLRAKVTVTVRDEAGNTASKKATIRLTD